MAQKRINDLQLRSDFDDTCNLPVDDASQSWRVTGAQITAAIGGAASLITGKTAKTAPIGADSLLIYDSVGTALKKSTKAEILKSSVTAKTGAYTATINDDVITGDATSAGFTVTLPAASTCGGKKFTIKKTDSSSNLVTIARAGSDTIDGATSLILRTRYQWVDIMSDGTSAWLILNRSRKCAVVASLSSGQSVPNSTYTTIAFDTVEGDSETFTTGTGAKFTAPRNGFYQVSAFVGYNETASATNVEIDLNKNGSLYRIMQILGSGALAQPLSNALSSSSMMYLAAGDYLEIVAYHTRGSAATTYTAAGCYMSVHEL